MGFKKILMIREGKEKERKEKEREKKTEREENRKTRGLTGLTVNSCFFYLPLAYLIIFKYIYTYFYICVGGGVCIFGVLTVNLLTLPG